jgi:hypothetical protein
MSGFPSGLEGTSLGGRLSVTFDSTSTPQFKQQVL